MLMTGEAMQRILAESMADTVSVSDVFVYVDDRWSHAAYPCWEYGGHCIC